MTVPVNVFASCWACCMCGVDGIFADPSWVLTARKMKAIATKSAIFFISHLRDNLWLDKGSTAMSVPIHNLLLSGLSSAIFIARLWDGSKFFTRSGTNHRTSRLPQAMPEG